MHRAKRLKRPSSHMWGVLPKKIKITGEKYPGNREALDHLEFYSNRQGEIRT